MLASFFKTAHFAAPLILLSSPLFAQTSSSLEVISRIKDEGLNHSQVMQTLSYLTDVIGPRLTGSPSMKRANEWTMEKLGAWGLQNGHLEAWGPFGRGWELERFSAQIVSPQDIPLIAFPKAWSPGLKGTLTGEVVYVDIKSEADLEKYKGKLHGAIVLNSAKSVLPAHFDPQGTRYSDEQLAAMANNTPAPRRPGGGRGGQGGRFQLTAEQRAVQAMAGQKSQLFLDEGVALLVDTSRGDDGTIFVQSATVPQPRSAAQPAGGIPGGPPVSATGSSAPASGTGGAQTDRGGPAIGSPLSGATGTGAPGSNPTGARQRRGQGAGQNVRRISAWDKNPPKMIPQIVVSSEQYNRMMRMLEQGEKLKMSVELAVKFFDKDLMSYNTIAEIPGSDLKEQIVMCGAHMDSWHSGTGATDNGAGCAVAMEAVRILKALNLQPRRTVRIGLWSGEEEGLYGSKAYVTSHFGTQTTSPGGVEAKNTPEFDKFSAYFNLDNGTGKIRGVYLQGNAAAGPIFQDWLTPFSDMGAKTVTMSNTGSTDHVSFDGIGLPGFQFIQDTIEYNTRTHHSNQDVFDRIQADDLKQASIIMAAFLYNSAMRDELIPRKTIVTP